MSDDTLSEETGPPPPDHLNGDSRSSPSFSPASPAGIDASPMTPPTTGRSLSPPVFETHLSPLSATLPTSPPGGAQGMQLVSPGHREGELEQWHHAESMPPTPPREGMSRASQGDIAEIPTLSLALSASVSGDLLPAAAPPQGGVVVAADRTTSPPLAPLQGVSCLRASPGSVSLCSSSGVAQPPLPPPPPPPQGGEHQRGKEILATPPPLHSRRARVRPLEAAADGAAPTESNASCVRNTSSLDAGGAAAAGGSPAPPAVGATPDRGGGEKLPGTAPPFFSRRGGVCDVKLSRSARRWVERCGFLTCFLWLSASCCQLTVSLQDWALVELAGGQWIRSGIFRAERGGGDLEGIVMGDSQVLLCPDTPTCVDSIKVCKELAVVRLLLLFVFFHSLSVEKPLYTTSVCLLSFLVTLTMVVVWKEGVAESLPEAHSTPDSKSTVSNGWPFIIYSIGLGLELFALVMYILCLLFWRHDKTLRIPPLFKRDRVRLTSDPQTPQEELPLTEQRGGDAEEANGSGAPALSLQPAAPGGSDGGEDSGVATEMMASPGAGGPGVEVHQV